MYLIDYKKIFKLFLSSIVLMVVLFMLIYGFDMKVIYVSNAMFYSGMSYFLTGLILVTNCGEVFAGVTYLTKKFFAGRKKQFFRTYGEYKEFKALNKRGNDQAKEFGYIVLAIGLVNILISIVLGFM